ncbi:DUF3073 domain-containing protein [Microbacterium horticulturae]|uniref:DUF3073 domain-containing protein n=1 Tax=Microbacterium horticulturae TaxID=3028316 RepID=A0ABY8BYU0_9MICO|nr:DUF3073 domain-containing protein [Microbacterium sp. KACC 23027]WEG09095.1 DUF3073 domain-containing protein [Microbacterium sp. KACC 23027]
MGRGRQKAKHTKIARELKYDTYNVNFASLERELGHPESNEDEYVDKWADKYADDEDDESAGSYQQRLQA